MGTANPATLTMDGNKAVTATFTQIFYTLQTNTVGSGTVTVNPPGTTQPALSTVTLDALAAFGWQFAGWSGGATGTDNPTSVVMNADTTVTATFTRIPAPVFDSQPTSQTANVGGTATFTATASGVGPITYQWRKGGTDLPGQTTNTLVLGNVQLSDAGSYTLAATNDGGTGLSAPASLSVTSTSPLIMANDSFADGERTTLALPGSANWYKAQSSTVVTMAPGSAKFTWNTTSADMIGAFFTPAGSPVSLGVGDTLSLSVTVAFSTLAVNPPTPTPTPALRFGVLDSLGTRPADNGGTSNAAYVNDTGYGVFTSIGPTGGGTAFTINRRTTITSNNIFNTGADFTTIASGGGTARAFANDTDYILTYTITRLSATQTRLTTAVVGGALPNNYSFTTTETNANPYTTFDYFGWRVASSNFAAAITFKNLTVTLGLVAPAITTQPTSISTVEFTHVVLTGAASGSGPLTLQWNKDGVPIPGATSSTLTLNNVHVADSGAYTLTATNPVGSVTSAVANVVVGLAPATITTQPLSQTILIGDPALFSVGVAGSPPFTYQWRKGGFDIAGATGPSFTIPALQLGDSGVYDVVVANGAGSVTSAPATLLVTLTPVAPSITVPPASTTVVVGSPVQFSVTAAGSTPLFYQWQKDGSPIPGATSPTYAIASAVTGDSGSYAVTVANSVDSITSAAAVLTVVIPPTIATPPASQIVNAGTPATFTVAANGSAPLAYQWLKNGAPISGATSAALTLPSVTAAAAGAYSVTVSNAGGSVTSAAAILTVADPALAITSLFPAHGGTGLPIDVPLRLTLGIAPLLGTSGLIQIRDTATNTIVDTIDLGAASQTKTIGGAVFNYLPVIVNGNVALVTPHVALAYNKTYSITVDPGVFRTVNGVFAGITGAGAWQFSTKPAAPPADATTIVVASDGTGDFATVQGAIDFVPAANALRRLISVRRGTYQELVRVNNKPLVTLRGESRLETVVAYANNANFNPSVRAAVEILSADVTIENLTLRNLTPKGGSQAEALRTNTTRFQLRNCDLYSFQDTLQLNGSAYVDSTYVEGDVDFMWGNAAAYFTNDELRNVTSNGYYVQSRTPAGQPGFVYVGSRLSGNAGVTGTFLARIDPIVFPDSQVVFIGSAIGPQVAPAGWLLNNATSSSTIRFWEYGSTDLFGSALDVSQRIASSRQLTSSEAAQWSDPNFVLGGWVPQTLPFIQAPPVSQIVSAGQDALLSVGATGVPAPSYQWQKDGATIPGATGATLLLPAVQTGAAGNYSVVVSNAVGSATSASATLAIGAAGSPTIASGPVAQTVAIADSATFSVVASGALGYQWLKDGAPIAGATSATLARSALSLADGGMYAVVVTNAAGSVASPPALLSVHATPIAAAPMIQTQPKGQIAFAGSTVTFSVVGRGVPPPAYQWFKDANPIPGASAATLSLPAVQLGSAGTYTVSLTNGLGSVTSDPAVLIVYTPAHLITQQPQNTGVNIGATATLSVVASGAGPVQYQWRKNGGDITGANAATLTIPNAQPSDTGVYTVLVTSLDEGELSAPAVLTVTSPSTQLPPVGTFNQEGFATMGPGTTGGGLVDPSDTVHYKVIDASTPNPAQTLRGYLESTDRLVVELRTDVDLGALNNQTRRPLINPELIASNLGVIRVGSNKTLFSDRGATLRHGTLNIDGSQNIIIRNLKLRGLWEWDDATQGQYDLQGWDFIALTNGARNVWIDHCDIGKAYDGQVDIVRGADMVTVSWTKFAGDQGTEAQDQVDYLEGLYQANPADSRISYYASLRQTQSVQQIVTHEIPQDKTSLVGNDDGLGAIDNGKLNVTYHHDSFTLLRQRTPRMRFGNAHVFNIFVDDTLSAPFPGTQTAVNSTTNAAVLVENSEFLEVRTPLMFSNGGRITQRGSAWTFGGVATPFDPARLNPVDPNALVFNPPAGFAWSDLAHLPYPYTLDAVDFVRNNPTQIGTIVPADATDQALLRSYLIMAGPFTPAPPPAVTYALSVGWSGSGNVAANPSLAAYVAGSSVLLTATPDAGWQFVGWSGDLGGTTNPATLTMDSDKSVMATFIPIVFPPNITGQTGSQTANAGDSVTFSVIATGTPPLNYQWRKDGDDVVGATGPALTLSPVQASHAGSYSVEVSNAAGVATSTPATLTVNVGPTFLLQERFADGTRAGQNLPASAAWWASSSQFTNALGQTTMLVSASRTMLAYFTNATAAPVAVAPNQTLALDFTVQFSGFDVPTTPPVPPALPPPTAFHVALLRSVANPAATSGTGFVASDPAPAPNTNARVSGDFGSNNPTSNAFTNYGGYVAVTSVGLNSTAAPVRLYARTNANPGLLNSTSAFTQFGASSTPSTPMAANTDYRGSLTLQNTGSGMTVTYTLKDAATNAVVMTYSAVQAATSFTQFDTVALYVNKNGSTNYNFIIKAVDVSLVGATPADPPTITTQPTSQTVAAGGSATFTVAADGTAPLSYQWQKNTSPIAGATSATYTIGSAQAADAAGYRVVVSNAAGSATSATALLTVDTGPSAPSITSQPASQVVVVGGSAIFSVLATGSAPLSYQWLKDGSPVAGATSATFSIADVQHEDAGGYSAFVSNEIGSATSASAVLTVTDTLPAALYDLAGFARAATGGGQLPESDPNYRKVFSADDLVAALGNSNTKVIEVMNDLDLGFNEVPASARTGALRSASAPLLHPVLLASGVSLIDIQDKNGLTIFSANGATIRHATFNVKRAHNVIIRNLKFDELWEWDESSKGKYDKQGWDFITVDMTSDDIWIDHCTFTKVYDGVVDVKGGTRNVTISWSSFLGDDGGPGSFVRRQIDALEANRSAYPMYDFLRSNGFSVDDVVAISRSQKKGHLVGANELDPQNANHQVTLHHNYYRNMQDRLPRLRAGNAHVFDVLVDNTEAFAAKARRDAVVAAMTPSNAAKLNGSSATYSFDVTLNGSISTEGGAVLLEKSQLIDVTYPLRNNQKDPSQAPFTGKILALDTLYQLGGLLFRGDSTTPGSPLSPVPAPELPFSWNGFATLPYPYSAADAAQLPSLLTGSDGAGAGKLVWPKENWLKTSYE
jgi:pectate lyase/pectin methylesterase-like acyl-CoA thioesterase